MNDEQNGKDEFQEKLERLAKEIGEEQQDLRNLKEEIREEEKDLRDLKEEARDGEKDLDHLEEEVEKLKTEHQNHHAHHHEHDNHDHDPHEDEPKITLGFIINGGMIKVLAKVKHILLEAVEFALERSGNLGRELKDWNVTYNDRRLETNKTLAELGLPNEATLYLSLNAGTGGLK